MHLELIAALTRSSTSNTITDVLGVLAVCSFVGIAVYIGYMMLRDSLRKSTPDFGKRVEPIEAPQKKEPTVAETNVRRETEKLLAERHYADFYDGVIDLSTNAIELLSQLSDVTFEQLAGAYASNSYGHEGENSAVRSQKFANVCERQWIGMRNDIGYMTHLDILDHLKYILENHRMLKPDNSVEEAASIEMSPDVLRSQELVALLRVITKDKIKSLQDSVLAVVGEFCSEYEREIKKPLDDILGKMGAEMRARHHSHRVADTSFYDRFRQLKQRLEIATNLTGRICQNTQRINQDSLALSQMIHVGALLRILASMSDWFGDFDSERTAAKPAAQKDAPVEARAS